MESAKLMELHFTRTNGPADQAIDKLMELVGGVRRPDLVREMILAALKAGQEDDSRADLKLMATSLKEMRFTSKIFSAYRNVKKVTVFGSARTGPEDEAYKMACLFGQKLSDAGFMVITGGGPGIMQAANEGAGCERSFGVSIRLPFEQRTNPILEGSPRSIMYKYFFNRKVAFLKESDAVALFPGGFGTLDEAMECLTLLQTGKRNPMPLVLLETPGGTYWSSWIQVMERELLRPGYISKSDFHLFDRFDSVEDAVRSIDRFYYRYHSLRYVREKLVIRITSELGPDKIRDLQDDFGDILRTGGKINMSKPLPEEADEPETALLPRLVVDFDRRDFGRLRRLIDAVNID
jgi:uncharacterized protein (TIGR00730 family)